MRDCKAADPESPDKTALGSPRHVGCGTIIPVRATTLGAIYRYDYDPAHSPRRVDDKIFDLNCVLITTRGTWRITGAGGAAEVDETRAVAGAAGQGYGCWHSPRGNSSYIVALGDGALDPERGPIFAKQIIPSRQALRLAVRAIRAPNDDAFDSLIFTLFEQASTFSTGSPGGHASRIRMQRVKRFIELHAFEQIELSDIASEVALSPFTVVRQFRSATGKTPYAYMLDLRLARAKQLLQTTDGSIRAVGTQVGFPDPAHFSRFFADAAGCPPTVFRSGRRGPRDGP
jgi:AraC-like DNA-binding protein